MTATADSADKFIASQRPDEAQKQAERQRTWDELVVAFRGDDRPDDDEVNKVQLIASCAIDRVFAAMNLSDEQKYALAPIVSDYAECAALYGYTMGSHTARQKMRAALRP